MEKLMRLKPLEVVLNRSEVDNYFQTKTEKSKFPKNVKPKTNGFENPQLPNYYEKKVNDIEKPASNNGIILKDLRVVLEDCGKIKRKNSLVLNHNGINNKKIKTEDANNSFTCNGNHKVTSSRCPGCLQFLDENLITYPTDKDDAISELDVIFDQVLKVDTGNAIDYDEQSKQDYKIVDFTIYDNEMHLCPFDSGLIENGNELFLSGVVKPIFDDDRSSKGGVYASKIGPITEWWSSGYDGGSDVIIGISSEYANYYLVTPSLLYAPFMKSTMVKVYLTKLVIEFLEYNTNGTYEDLINNIQSKLPPDGYNNFTEENLIHHAQFVFDHIASYDAVADEDEISLCQSQCLKTLAKLAGVTKEKKVRSETAPVQQKIMKPKPIESKATTTPLVRRVFETIFRDQIANLQKNGSKMDCGGCKKSDCQKCKNKNGNKKNISLQQSDSDNEPSDSDEEFPKQIDDEVNEKSFTKISRSNNFNVKSQVSWIGKRISSSENKIFYDFAKVNGETIKVGDCVLINTEDNVIFVGRVIYMFENQNNKEKMFHCHWFCNGSETVLGGAAKKNLLFLIDNCENVCLSDIKSKCKVLFKPPPSNWAFMGGNEDEFDDDDVNDCYFYNKWYQKFTARFEDPPSEYMKTSKKFECNYCPCCSRLESTRKKKKVQLGDEMKRNLKYVYYNDVSWNGEKYHVGDQIFLMPDAFKFDVKIEKTKQEKKTKIVDERIYTEYYRKSKHVVTTTLQEPFKIGHLESIYCRSPISSNLAERNDVIIKVKKLYRPENTHEGASASHSSDFNLLYWSNEEVDLGFPMVTGKCNVIYEDVSSKLFYWDSNEHNFYFNKIYDAETKSFEDPSNELIKLRSNHKISKTKIKQLNGYANHCLKTMDVFSGCGGLSEGLHQSGVCETYWAVEFEETAAKAFQKNNPKSIVYNENCNNLLKTIMEGKVVNSKNQKLPRKGEVEFLCGGPPCQGFSGMNRFTFGQYSQFKNSLIASYLSYCDFYRPKYFLLENVRNFFSFKQNMVLKLTLQCLIEMGYQCTFGVLQAGNYGVPQSRHRAFILAAAPGQKLPFFPEPLHSFNLTGTCNVQVDDRKYKNNTLWTYSAPYRSVTVRDSLSDLPAIKNGAKIENINYNPKKQSHFQKLMRRKMFDDTVSDHICKDMKALVVARMELIPCEPCSDWRDLPNTEVVLSDGTVTKKLIYRYTDSKNGRGKNGVFRGVCQCNEDKIFKKCNPLYRQPQDNTIIPWCLPHTGNRHNNWAGLYGRLELDSYFRTTITNPEPLGKQGKVLHPNQHRLISVRECARSQGFPDSYEFYGNILDRHRQIGNAVPPPLARAIGLEIKKCIENK